MEPNNQTIQPPAATQAGGQPNSLDPQVVKLADSIAKTESGGNSKAAGKSGEFGAYQWTTPTWQKESQASGINVSLQDSTPEQQNQVAYNQLSKWKSEGYTPAQEASMWNAGGGEPDAYLGSFNDGHEATGTNGSGAQYDVPGYVSKVMGLFDGGTANAASSPTSNTQSSSQPSWLSVLEGLGFGAAGLVAGNAAKLLKEGLPAAGTAIGEAIEPAGGGLIGEAAGAGLANLIPGESGGGSQPPQNTSPTGNSEGSQIPAGGPQNPEDQILLNDAINSSGESQKVASATNEALQTTQSNRIFSQSPAGQQAIQTASMFGLLSPDENGNFSFDENARKEALSQIAELDDKAIEADGGIGSPLSVANYAGSYIGNSRLNTLEEKDDAAEKVKKSLMREAPNGINGQMSLSMMRQRMKEHGAAARGKFGEMKTSAEILHHKAMRDAYGEAITQNLKDPGAKEVHKQALKMEQHLIRSKDLGKRLHGKKIPQKHTLVRKMLQSGAKYAEIYIGDRIGGPIGAVLGAMAGEHINRAIDKKFGKNIFETKGMKAALDILHEAKPQVYTKLVENLKKQGVQVPKDETPSPKTEAGLVGLIKRDEKKMGKKGLISSKLNRKTKTR